MKDIIIFEDSLENTVAYVEKLNEMSLVSKIMYFIVILLIQRLHKRRLTI